MNAKSNFRRLASIAAMSLFLVSFTFAQPKHKPADNNPGVENYGPKDSLMDCHRGGDGQPPMMMGCCQKGEGHQMGRCPKEKGSQCGPRGGESCCQIPDLTPDQQKKIDEFKLKNIEICTPLKNQLREKEAHLQTILTVASVDNKEVEKTINDISNLKSALLKQAVAFDLQIRSVLNPEQKIIFDSKPKHFIGKGKGKCSKGNRMPKCM
jgi:Spy/CpxP family protein refolding chaperone